MTTAEGKAMKRWPERLARPVFAHETAAVCFWQSRAGMRRPPQLTDLPGLARNIRSSWQFIVPEPRKGSAL